MGYRIIISCNGKKKKVLHKSDDIKHIKKKYFFIKDKNKVLFPKKTNAYKKTTPVKYELILMKQWEVGDTPFTDRDELGRTVEVGDINKKWTILHKDEYFYEEKFTIYGLNERLTSIVIIKKMLMKKQKRKGIIIKQVNYVNNKLLIHQYDDFDLVICKCPEDCKRLYDILKDFCDNNKVKNIMFTGAIGKLSMTNTYKMIMEKTGWDRWKTYRTVTRP
tara:strand:+ start:6620 stop:7276 length:657 start_codon:yes stop_codon:yes gene_type:complete